MENQILLTWDSVDDQMNDDYRDVVIRDALAYLPLASPDLRKLAKEVINKTVQINGFRQSVNAPQKKLRQQVSMLFRKNKAIASAIICLWAEKEKELIGCLQVEAVRAGLLVQQEWSWINGIHGFYGNIPELYELGVTLGKEKESPEKDNYMLAALWLSGSLSSDVTATVDNSGNSPIDSNPTDIPDSTNPQSGSIEGPQIETPKETARDMEKAGIQLSIDVAELERKSIAELSLYWETQSEEIIGARDAALAKVEDLKTSALRSDPSEMREKMKQLEVHLKEWVELQAESVELVDYIQARIARELQLRPDIKQVQSEVSVLSDSPSETELLAILPTVFQAITAYDHRKAGCIENAANLRNELLHLEQSLSLWKTDVILLRHQIQQLSDPQDLTLQQFLTLLENSRKVVQEAKEKREQARAITIRRILDTVVKMEEIPGEREFQLSKYRSSQLTEKELDRLPGKELQDLEHEILTIFNLRVAKANTGNSQKIAASLKACWNDGILEQLLGHLADEKKDLEAILIEMAASVVYPRQERSVYSRAIARSLFNGVSELSTNLNPYHLLNKLASFFFLSWTSSEPVTRYERCILALAAQAGNDTGLPAGFLWQVETDWPEASMPDWDRLWQAALLEEDIQIYTDQKVLEYELVLDTRQKELEVLFAKDGGHYLRIGSIKSDRHRLMMTSKVIPQFLEYYAGLTRLRKQLEAAAVEKHAKILGELQQMMVAMDRSLTEKKLEELYQKGVNEFDIDDINNFHIKVCMRILSEISTAILNYGNTLLALESLRATRRDGLSYQNLLAEINKSSNSNTLVKHALDQISQGSLKRRTERNEDTETKQGIQHIVTKLLSDGTCAPRFSNTIISLVREPFGWATFLDTLLADIEDPQSVMSAAQHLLDHRATSQVLQVVQQLPLEVQKLAQSLHREQEKHVNDLEDEFIKLGGDCEWAKPDYELGRWGYLSTRLSQEIASLKKRSEEEHERIEMEAFAIREQINRLDMNIFKSRSTIPVGVFGLIQNGLTTARKSCEVPRLFPQIREYLDEVEYRLKRESWIETELENATQALEKQLMGTQDEENLSMNAVQILEAFNLSGLTKLGLDPDDFEDSKITTRVNILDNWLAIKKLRTILSANLTRVEINKIKSLFSYFARMQQMTHSRGVDRNYMSYENPIVHEYWELRFPRTPALAKQCVMIALPGDPPSADDLQSLDEFLEKEDFLAAHFVFLFIPGCTPKIAKRVNQNYAKQGLILVDETALIRMILAERENQMVPLGKLRPLMLNSTGANADIFTVNQSVNSHTSIFYGRDTVIDRIASSGDNYAIYGGRRIGKSSVLKALEQKLEHRNIRVISYSLEGETEYSEEYVAKKLAGQLKIQKEYEETKDFKSALFSYLDANPDESIVLILDEIDRYISENHDRHTLIEALRATSDSFEHRFRVIIAGFMELYDCLSGRGPYTPSSDPWRRMLNNMGPLENLKPADAEEIVEEGFRRILGWTFEHRAIPRRIVERTGGHPAFVQYFCMKLQEQVSKREDQIVTLKDIDKVFDDNTPEKSFIWFVRKTLEMNLSDPAYKQNGSDENKSDPVSRYILLWLAFDSSTNNSQTFTLDQIREIADLSKVHIPEKLLLRSLELLTVTSVVREKSSQLYEFTVPDYPLILNRLGDGSKLDALEAELKAFLEGETV